MEEDDAMGGVTINGKVRMTDEERSRIQQAIAGAKDLREIKRLETLLREGQLP